MKKFLWLLFFVTLFSCGKENVLLKPAIEATSFNKNTVIYSENYAQTIYDSCISDSVALHGLETYKLTQYSDTLGNYFVRYEIDLSNVIGVSKKDSIVFSGGGKIVDAVRQFNNKFASKINMRIVYKSNVGQIIFTQLARLIETGNTINLYFDSGYIQSCK